LGLVASFSVEIGRPMVVIHAMTGLGDMASGENWASTSVMANDGGVSGWRYLREGIVYGVLIV
jgi:hypothetical protein